MPDLAQLETFLNSRLFGEREAVAEFCSVVVRAVEGPKRENRPRAFILLLGPTGTGKTEITKLTAKYLYGTEDRDGRVEPSRLEQLDMGEYQHPDSVKRLLGAPDQRPLLGEAIDRLNAKGGGILLLDEIEKAFPDLLTALLSFDSARSTMADGATKDLSQLIIVLTSNLGAAEAARMENSGYSAIRRKLMHAAEEKFRKEGVARMTAVCFTVLSYEVQVRITKDILQRELAIQSQHFGREVMAGPEVVTFLVGKGFTPDFGARNIRNTVEKHIGEALSPYTFLKLGVAAAGDGKADPDPDGVPGKVGDRWSRTLVITTEGDALAAWPLKRSATMEKLLSSLAA